MRRVKLLVILGGVLFSFACFSSGAKKRYMIAESKAYEASLFRQYCAICHGPEADGRVVNGRQVPNLREGEFKYKTDAEIYNHIANGGNGMVPFRGHLTDREINMMVRFVQDQLRK